MHLFPQFDFSTPDFRIFRTKNTFLDITNEVKTSSFYLDTTSYKAAIEPLAFGRGVQVLFIVAGKGISIQILRQTYGATVGYLNFNIGIPKSFYNKARGILGNFDGSEIGELRDRTDRNIIIPVPGDRNVDMESCELLSINNFGEIYVNACGIIFFSLFRGRD